MTFLRPQWFLMLLPVAMLAFWYWNHRRDSRSWAAVIDPQLLPYLLTGAQARRSRRGFLLILCIAVLVVTALAGPAWQKREQPVFRQTSALVIALDLSSSMLASDIKPSRLERARLKLIDLLRLRTEGQTALIAYAAAPFTVAPLTDDFETIAALLPSLTPDIMPAQGSRADLAVFKAIELFDNAGLGRGDILLITDGVSDRSLTSLHDRHMPGFRLSILAIGSEEGAPIPDPAGGFIKDADGAIVLARTDYHQLQNLAVGKDGLFVSMALDDSDILAIDDLVNRNSVLLDHEQAEFKADRWREEGPWLLLLVAPLAALAFRRGVFLGLLIALLLAPVPGPVNADSSWWDRLWRNSDQLGQHRMQQGDPAAAAQAFSRPDWKAAANYRAGDYAAAAREYETLDTADSFYNRGNALARLGQLEQALESYQRALQIDPKHEDASFNQQVVEQALRQQQQQEGPESSEPATEQENKQEQSGQKERDENQQQGGSSGNEQQQDDQSTGGEHREAQDGQEQGQDGPGSQQQHDDAERDVTGQEGDEGQQPERPADDAFAGGNDEQDEGGGSELQDEQTQQHNLPDESAQEAVAASPDAADENTGLATTEELSEQAEAQWLRRIPDDPGGLLRNKFRYQYNHQRGTQQEREPW